MTAQECLLHAWLSGDHSDRNKTIDQSRYLSLRDRIRAKYDAWDSFALPIGRLSEYSSLRKLLIDKYKIHDTYFGKYSNRPNKEYLNQFVDYFGRSQTGCSKICHQTSKCILL